MQDIKHAFRDVFPYWLALCIIAVIFGLAMQLLPGFMEGANYYPTTWAANLAHADPHSYVLVAEQGYGAEGRGLQTSVRFPLFPFLTRATIQLTGIDPDVSIFVLSKAALLVGLIGIWLLVAHVHGREQAERAALYVVFPLLGSGYTWMMSYNEPLHLALWTFGFLLLYKRHHALCGLITVLNVWTRPHSVLILPCFALALAADAIRERGLRGLLDRNLWLRGLVTCGLPLLVGIIGVLMFATAGQPISDESEAALAWIRALCDGRADDLYALSIVTDGVDAAAFAEQVTAYLSTGEIPQPCIPEVNYNLIRTLVVPDSLKGRVDSVRFFGQVNMHSDESDYSASMPLWLYHTADGWRVWATFMGMTPERAAAAGETATVLDANGAALATIRIVPPATAYRSGCEALVGVPVELQTLSKPWEYYEARLYVANHRAQAVEREDGLPEELRGDFLVPQGNYSPQNCTRAGYSGFAPTP